MGWCLVVLGVFAAGAGLLVGSGMRPRMRVPSVGGVARGCTTLLFLLVAALLVGMGLLTLQVGAGAGG